MCQHNQINSIWHCIFLWVVSTPGNWSASQILIRWEKSIPARRAVTGSERTPTSAVQFGCIFRDMKGLTGEKDGHILCICNEIPWQGTREDDDKFLEQNRESVETWDSQELQRAGFRPRLWWVMGTKYWQEVKEVRSKLRVLALWVVGR